MMGTTGRGAAEGRGRVSEDDPACAQSKLALVREAVQAGFWTYDLRTGDVEADGELLALYGHLPDGQPARELSSVYELWREHVHPEDRPWVEARLQEARERLQPWDLIYRIQRADDEVRYVRSLGRPEWDELGHPRCIVGMEQDVTQEVERESSLETANYHLENAERIARLGHWVSYPESGELVWSRVTYELGGFDPDGPPPDIETFLERIPLEDHHQVAEFQFQAQPERSTCEGTYRIQHPDGQTLWVREVAEQREDEQGRWVIQGTVQDVTEQRALERALREREAHYRDLVENQPLMIDRYWPDSTITYANRVLADYFGTQPEALVGQRWLDFLPAEERERAQAHLASFTPQEPVGRFENSLPGEDGQWYWMLWTNRAFFDEGGALSHFQSVGVDITGRRRAERAEQQLREQLEARQRELEGIFEAARSVSLIKTDVSGFIQEVSAGTEAVYGYPREALIGSHVSFLHPEAGRDPYLAYMDRLAREHEPVRLETERRRRDGSTFPALLTVHPITDDRGELVAILGVSLDISEQKRAEEALRERQDWLDRGQEIAERIVAQAMRSDDLEAPGVRYAYQPAAILSGDILLAERRPNGDLLVLIGDFTGHGIAAAAGVPGLAAAFYEQVRRGAHPVDLLDDINARLYESLPVEMFLAAALIEVDARQARVGVCNAGMPPLWLLRGPEVVDRFPSSEVPLGITPDSAQGRRGLVYMPVPEGGYLYACSDGVTEAMGEGGAQFGVEGVERILGEAGAGEAFDQLLSQAPAFGSGAEPGDDATVVALELERLLAEHQRSDRGAVASVDSDVEFALDAAALARLHPVPAVMDLLTELLTLESDRQSLYFVIAELYTNALEHGILELDSGLKATADGFEAYYRQRREALRQLERGWITFRVACEPASAAGYRITIEVEDSGAGFDYEQVLGALESEEPEQTVGALAAGRGILLVRSLCEEVTYFPPGNRVRARYRLGGNG